VTNDNDCDLSPTPFCFLDPFFLGVSGYEHTRATNGSIHLALPFSLVIIDLTGTPLHTEAFTEIVEEVDPQRFPLSSRWLSCYIENGTWHGAGDEKHWSVSLNSFSRGLKIMAVD
jgi:hypothetical protein